MMDLDYEQVGTSAVHGRIGYTCIGGVTTCYRFVGGAWVVTTDPAIIALLSGTKLIDNFRAAE